MKLERERERGEGDGKTFHAENIEGEENAEVKMKRKKGDDRRR